LFLAFTAKFLPLLPLARERDEERESIKERKGKNLLV
jgi:hypothetical protein